MLTCANINQVEAVYSQRVLSKALSRSCVPNGKANLVEWELELNPAGDRACISDAGVKIVEAGIGVGFT